MVDLSKRAIDGLITFLYYGDLDKAEKFYREAMGLELTIDQGWAKIFKLAENAYVGLVDGNRGYHRPSPTKPVMITILVRSEIFERSSFTSKLKFRSSLNRKGTAFAPTKLIIDS